MVRKKAWIFALTLLILLCFSGCYGADIDELYSLPQPQKEYLKLQELINNELAAGCEYSAPTAGSRRQSVQIVDLDGDGTGEALAFLRDRDLTPIICIYRFVSNNYQLAASITGDGSAIGRVEYADLNGDGVSEILTSWKTSTELRLLKAYSILDWESAAVLSASCTDFQICDMDMNGISDVVALNFEPGLGSVSVYTLDPDGEVTVSSAKT
ncbi:MAG: VCBS repeat-containing protein, partial [Oscillospiraceae bacterium]